jgi:hypothetical protein
LQVNKTKQKNNSDSLPIDSNNNAENITPVVELYATEMTAAESGLTVSSERLPSQTSSIERTKGQNDSCSPDITPVHSLDTGPILEAVINQISKIDEDRKEQLKKYKNSYADKTRAY